MKSIFMVLGLFVLQGASADTHVSGHHRKDGTYVAPHMRSDRDNSFNNNWSTQGNSNPYTGKRGYKKSDQNPNSVLYNNDDDND